MESFKDYLLTLSITHLTVFELNTGEPIKSIELDGILNLNLIQLVPIKDRILIFDLEKQRMIYIDEDWLPHVFAFPHRLPSGKFIVTEVGGGNFLFFNSLSYYEFDLMQKKMNEIPSIYVRKLHANFRYVTRDLFNITHNVLSYNDKDGKVLYHFHGDKKESYDDKDFGKPYYLHDDSNVSRIGVYDVHLNHKQVEFIAPETIAFGGWFEWADDDLTPNQSVIKGVLETDKIILCYPKTIYVLNLEGKILEKLDSIQGNRFTNINLINKDEVLISEYSAVDQISKISRIRILQ